MTTEELRDNLRKAYRGSYDAEALLDFGDDLAQTIMARAGRVGKGGTFALCNATVSLKSSKYYSHSDEIRFTLKVNSIL